MVKYAAVALALMLLLLGESGQVAALADVSRSFVVAGGVTLTAGSLVSTENGGTEVAAANTQNGSKLIGAVVAVGAASLALEAGSAQNMVQVVLNGEADIYATTLGGDIHAGDAVSVSPVSGFGMRAEQGLRVVGVAQADLTSGTTGVRQLSIKDRSGHLHTVYMGTLPVVVGVSSGMSAVVPSDIVGSIQSLATVVAGHQVSTLQAALSFAIVVLSVGALMALIYGAIHAGIIAIGRNPLARRSILRSVLQIAGMSLLIAAVAAIALYFTLHP